jgi:hypothetical protein
LAVATLFAWQWPRQLSLSNVIFIKILAKPIRKPLLSYQTDLNNMLNDQTRVGARNS